MTLASEEDGAFAGFELSQITVGEVSLRVRHGGSGPPLLLLHGYPQTHMMWGQVAGGLAEDFTVVAPDLRGYGDSSKPESVPDHASYGKRAMARDVAGLMHQFGFESFDVAGHDRGGRVTYRLALDHPQAVRRLTVLDIVPTSEAWAHADRNFALDYWHWPFLARPYPFPETLIGHDPEWFFFDSQFGADAPNFRPEARADYVRCARNPAVVHAICEDYRAGATYDRLLDEQDHSAGRRIACPIQVLWGAKGRLGGGYDPLTIWRGWADDVTGDALDSGHFLAEEKPAETLAALRRFHGEGR
ncbi:alpha/beta fold hydrolase [Pseudonocardia xinjiangensis]|uniref:Alpha/beta hydrolase n=1 Tax=Pseudonocardia xinjiangensis TaxID=75289 RepID=A0ABX1RD19_9PSEU|nr:alpha/beta hydrolase [Pseudonocardia xinjiangensis]NMH77123.1 alpha/beta hydrolase [Pseudonocardia xinjiangensis]